MGKLFLNLHILKYPWLGKINLLLLDLDHQCDLTTFPELYKQRLNLQSEFCPPKMQTIYFCAQTEHSMSMAVGQVSCQRTKTACSVHINSSISIFYDNFISDPSGITDTIKSFYSCLYKSEFPSNTANMNQFLEELEFSHTGVADSLDSPILTRSLTLEGQCSALKPLVLMGFHLCFLKDCRLTWLLCFFFVCTMNPLKMSFFCLL